MVDTADALEIEMPARRNVAGTVFLALWLLFWFGVGIPALTPALDGTQPATVIVASFWLLAGLLVLVELAWRLTGRMRVRVTSSALTITRVIAGIGVSKTYAAESIHRLRRESAPRLNARGRPPAALLDLGLGALAFDCDGRTVRFGAHLTADAAAEIHAALIARFPGYARL